VTEEIFGQIEDEYDQPRVLYRKLGAGKYLVSGRMEIDDLNKLDFEVKKVEGIETLAGWVISHLGRIPKTGEEVTIGDLKIRIVLADKVSIKVMSVEKEIKNG
jgi:CBS domain containing-hemolysin-like protein